MTTQPLSLKDRSLEAGRILLADALTVRGGPTHGESKCRNWSGTTPCGTDRMIGRRQARNGAPPGVAARHNGLDRCIRGCTACCRRSVCWRSRRASAVGPSSLFVPAKATSGLICPANASRPASPPSRLPITRASSRTTDYHWAEADGSFDFVFSFNSLVHGELDVFTHYIPQIIGKLTPNGVAFIHHSNLRAVPDHASNPHCRATSVDAAQVAALIVDHGGCVLVQEIVNWGGQMLSDCLTMFGRATSPASRPASIVITNPRFMDEAEIIRASQSDYSKIRTDAAAFRNPGHDRPAHGLMARLQTAWRRG